MREIERERERERWAGSSSSRVDSSANVGRPCFSTSCPLSRIDDYYTPNSRDSYCCLSTLNKGAVGGWLDHLCAVCRAYKIKHFLVFFSFLVNRAARVACSNTSLTPSFVLAEHSRYFWAPIFLRTSSALGELVSHGFII